MRTSPITRAAPFFSCTPSKPTGAPLTITWLRVRISQRPLANSSWSCARETVRSLTTMSLSVPRPTVNSQGARLSSKHKASSPRGRCTGAGVGSWVASVLLVVSERAGRQGPGSHTSQSEG